ncbi:MAG: hypothetical protein Q7U43_01490 [Methylococcaceae bacterium]|nr:hypothetical protein [Methylococcaceae bacterium]
MKFRKNLVSALLIGGAMAVSGQASAHWSSGPFLYNDAGSNPLNLANGNLAAGVTNNGTGANASPATGTNVATGTSYGTYTQTRATSSDYGWIQGQDNTLWANSHDNKGLAFSLTGTSLVSFTVTTLGTAASVLQTQATGGTTSTPLTGLDWNPAFSIFKGLAPQSSHEGGAGNTTLANNIPGYVSWGPYASAQPYTAGTDATYEATTGNTYTGNGTWGAYRSNADWTGGRDVSTTATYGNGNLIGTSLALGGGNVSTLDYIDAASSAPGGHTVTWTGTLGPGDYSIWVGGTNAANAATQQNNYIALANHLANGGTAADATGVLLSTAIADLRKSYGFTIQTTVAAVPVPATVWLMITGLMGLLGLQKRNKMVA